MNLLSLLLPHITRLQFVKHWLLTRGPHEECSHLICVDSMHDMSGTFIRLLAITPYGKCNVASGYQLLTIM